MLFPNLCLYLDRDDFFSSASTQVLYLDYTSLFHATQVLYIGYTHYSMSSFLISTLTKRSISTGYACSLKL